MSSVHFELYPFQMDLMQRSKSVIAAISGTGSGKSYAGSWKLFTWLLDGPHGARYYAVGPTLGMLRANLWREFILRLGDAGLREDRDYAYNRTELTVTLKGRNTAVIGKTADKPSTMQSTHVHGIVADEAGLYAPDAWHVIQQRVSLYKGQIFLPSTPYTWNFLKKDIYDKWLEAGKDHESIDVLQISSLANPNFPREEYEKAKQNLPRWKFDMFYNGRFTKPSGLVYSEFQTTSTPLAQVHRIFAGLDYGFHNPTAVVWIADDGRGNYQVFRVWKKSKAELTTISEALKRERCRYYADPSAAGIIAELKKDGHMISPARNDVMAGITVVDGMMRSGKLTLLQGGEGVDELIEELGLYSWQTDGNGEPVEKIEKNNDHACDALRYAIFSGIAASTAQRAVHGASILATVRETARY